MSGWGLGWRVWGEGEQFSFSRRPMGFWGLSRAGVWSSFPCGLLKGLDHALFLTHENGLRALLLGTHLDRHGPQPYAEAHSVTLLVCSGKTRQRKWKSPLLSYI